VLDRRGSTRENSDNGDGVDKGGDGPMVMTVAKVAMAAVV